MGWYLPSPMARVPDEEPSTNSTGGGRSCLKVSISFAGRYWAASRSSEGAGVG